MLASLIAALIYLSSHLNWGSSYLTLDFYKRFINKDATENQIVSWKVSTVLLMITSSIIACF